MLKRRYVKPNIKTVKIKVYFMTRRTKSFGDNFLASCGNCQSTGMAGCCVGDTCFNHACQN